MADPQTKQPIEDTSGFIVLPDGRKVPTFDTWWNQQANNPQGLGAEQQRTRLGQQYATGAQAVTNALGDIVASPDIAAEKLGILAPEFAQKARDRNRSIAGAVVPQTLTQAGITAGMVAGGLGGAALGVGKGLGNAMTVMGGTGGGVLGGQLEYGTPEGMLAGGGQGLIESGAGVAASELWDLARKIGPNRVKTRMNVEAAQNVGEILEHMPSLKGVFKGVKDERSLRDLVLGTVVEDLPDGRKSVWIKGNKILSDFAAQRNAQITQMIPPQFGPRFPDALEPGTFVTWEGARRSLSELGRKAYGTGAEKAMIEPTVKGIDSKLLYKDTIRGIQRQLTFADPSGEALRLFNEGQQVVEAGKATLKLIRTGFTGVKGARRPQYNHEAVQDTLATKQGFYEKKIPDFWALAEANAVTPQTIGQVDVFQPHGALSQMAGVIPGPAGGYMRVHAGWADVVGNRTAMPLSGRMGLQTGVAQGLSMAGDPLNQAMQGNGIQVGIPGLGR